METHKTQWTRTFYKVLGKEDTVMAATSIDAMMYGGISIAVLIGVLAMGIGDRCREVILG